jgi:hypothetical protein
MYLPMYQWFELIYLLAGVGVLLWTEWWFQLGVPRSLEDVLGAAGIVVSWPLVLYLYFRVGAKTLRDKYNEFRA